VTTRGVVYIHATPTALCPHIEWAIGGVLGARVSLEWTGQPAAPGMVRAELSWQGEPGAAPAVLPGTLAPDGTHVAPRGVEHSNVVVLLLTDIHMSVGPHDDHPDAGERVSLVVDAADAQVPRRGPACHLLSVDRVRNEQGCEYDDRWSHESSREVRK